MNQKKVTAEEEEEGKKDNDDKWKENLIYEIIVAARDCTSTNDLNIRLSKLNNNRTPLKFGQMQIQLIDSDPLDQMIDMNLMPPIDEWFCPICSDRMCVRNADNIETWEVHFCEVHKLSNFNYENQYLFLLYGITYMDFAQFDEDQGPNKHTIIRHNPDFDVDYKCLIMTCKTYYSDPYMMGEHILRKHKHYKPRNALNLPSFWKFLRLNANENKGTTFYDFLKLFKHPWLNTPIYRCLWCSSSYKCQKIFSTRAVHDDHPGVWYN
jgi:hypothetical protein